MLKGKLLSNTPIKGESTEFSIDIEARQRVAEINGKIIVLEDTVDDFSQSITQMEVKIGHLEEIIEDIPEVPTKVSELENDVGYLTEHQSLNDYYTKSQVDDLIPTVPTNISAFNNDIGYLTEHQSLSDYYTKSQVDTLIPEVPTKVSELENDAEYITREDIPTSSIIDVEVNGVSVVIDGTAEVIVPTKTSDLTNDSGFITRSDIPSGSVVDVKVNGLSVVIDGIAEITSPTKVSDLTNDSGFITYSAISEKADKSEIPTKTSELTNDSGFLTSHQSLTNYYTKTEVQNGFAVLNHNHDSVYQPIGNYALSGHGHPEYVNPTVTAIVTTGTKIAQIGNISLYSPVSESGIDDVTVGGVSVVSEGVAIIPAIPTVPTNISAFTNDVGYLTSHQSLANYYTKSQVDDLIPEVPVNVSEFNNDAGYLTEHQSLSNYYTKSQLYTKTEVDNLIPTVPTKTSDLTNDSNFISDSSYVHTDYNYNSTAKAKVDAIPSNPKYTDTTYTAGTGISITNGVISCTFVDANNTSY